MQTLSVAFLLAATSLVPRVALADGLDCRTIVADKIDWNISPLKGPHSVSELAKDDTPPTNITYTFNLCGPLKSSRNSKAEKGCEHGAWACAYERPYDDKSDEEGELIRAWSIAGTFTHDHGGTLDETVTRLKGSSSSEEQEQGLEGVRIEYNGGKQKGNNLKMIATLLCDRKSTDNEDSKLRRADDDGDDEDSDDSDKDLEKGLRFVSYKTEPLGRDNFDVLRIEWKTPYACEDAEDVPASKSAGWGFFTWFIIVAFLIIAAYLIFGSWLNYNRHGARGWDLLPHGDTIRDIPYILKDWGRSVANTVQGGGSTGGYNRI